MKKWTVFAMALSAIGLLYAICDVKKNGDLVREVNQTAIEPHVTSLVQSSDKITLWLNQQQAEVWEHLSKYGIDEDRMNEGFDQFADEYKKDIEMVKQQYASDREISFETLNLIDELFHEFSINKSDVEIVSFDDPSAAAANNFMLFINEPYLKTFSKKAQRFVIAHEIQHIINSDDQRVFILQKLLPSEGRDKPEHPLNVVFRFQEMRADLQTIQKNVNYSQAQADFLGAHLEKYGDGPGITHPQLSFRIQMGQKMVV